MKIPEDIRQLGKSQTNVQDSKVLHQLKSLFQDYKNVRLVKEDYWYKSYVAYLTTADAKRAMTATAKEVVGDVKVDWRHRLKSPKAYETVETIVSYLMGAFFPNSRWFDFKPVEPIQDPSYKLILELNRRFVSNKLDKAKFKQKVEILLRETCITGTAVMMFPWYSEDNNVRFQVLSPFDFFLDPRSQDPNDANFIRQYTITKAEALNLQENGTFELASPTDIEEKLTTRQPWNLDTSLYQSIKQLQGLSSHPHSHFTTNEDKYVCYEFWGDLLIPGSNVILKNVKITWTDGLLLSFIANPFGEHKPFLVSTYTQTQSSPYGLGALQPILSQLYYKDVMASRHADSVVAAVDPVYEVVHDGVVDFDKAVFTPGAKIPVTQIGSIQPIQSGGNFNVSVNDMSIVEQTIDKATGTGPYIGVGAGRSGERVTAEEIRAQRDAGGNRLTNVYSNLELTFMLPLLSSFREYCRLMYEGSELVTLPIYGEDAYVSVDYNTLNYNLDVVPLGSNNVADKEYNLRNTLDWLGIVGNNPEMAQRVNWSEVLNHITYMMMPDHAEKFIISPEVLQQQQQAMAQQPVDPVSQGLQAMRANGMNQDATALEAQLAVNPQGAMNNVTALTGAR